MQNTGGTAPLPVGDISCWHCGRKGHNKSDCPKLQVQEISVGVQNLNIGNCEEGHGLSSSKKDKGLAIVQDKKKEEKECEASSRSITCTSTCAPVMQAPHTVNTWGMWKCTNVLALWDTAMRGHVEWTPPETWGPLSRCGSTKEGLH
jgi:hypothetical protein